MTATAITPRDMLADLLDDNRKLADLLRSGHQICERHGDVATTSLIEVWVDQTERRAWFLNETVSGL